MSPGPRCVFFATCVPGLEPVLHEEARALGLARLERQVGGIYFEGLLADAWRANRELRSALRVLLRLARFPARDADELYAGVVQLPWEEYLRPEGTLFVAAQCRESNLAHSLFIEQRVKDAVVDRFRARDGTRPDVDREDPDLRIHLHLHADRATLSLDTSGEALHKRGWRVHQGRAPLAENLAHALLHYSGWDGRGPLVDPFCGSGTIAIEAACRAEGLAPGSRRAFGFERWLDHDAPAYARWKAGVAPSGRARRPPILVASDSDPERLAEAQANARSAGVAEHIRFEVADARTLALTRGWNAAIVTNPPYGLRVGASEGEASSDDVLELHRAFGARLRAVGVGSRLALLALDPAHVRALGLRGLTRLPLTNGGLACVVALGEV